MVKIERFINKDSLIGSNHNSKLSTKYKMLKNKRSKAILSIALLSFLIVSLFAVSVSAGLFDDLFGKEKEVETSTIWKTTAQGPIIKNNDGTYTKTLGSQTYRDDKTRRFPNYVPFEDTINVTEENGKLKITDLVEDEEYYIELEYEKKNSMSISNNKFEINKNRGSWYFTSDAQTEVNSMEYKINSEKDITFKDEKLILNNEVAIDFKQARTEQNITTTYDSKTKKLIFEMEKDEFGKTKGGSLSMIDPTIILQDADTENLDDAYVELWAPNSNFGSEIQLRAKSNETHNEVIVNSYIKFNLSSLNIFEVINANLSLKLAGFIYTTPNNVNISLYNTSNDWEEGNLTYNNAPSSDLFIQSIAYSGADNIYLFDITDNLNKSKDLLEISFFLNKTILDNGGMIALYSKEASTAGDRPKLEINYVPGIDIITPTPAQIFTEDAPTTYFNISTAVNMDTCSWSPDTGVTNYTMTSVNSTFFTLANTSMVDGAHTIVYYCNQSSDGTWRTSDTVSFDVDSVNVTVCRDLTVSRTYYLRNNLIINDDCIKIYHSSVSFNLMGYEINRTVKDTVNVYSGIYSSGYDSIKIYNGSINKFEQQIYLLGGTGINVTNMNFFDSRGYSIYLRNINESEVSNIYIDGVPFIDGGPVVSNYNGIATIDSNNNSFTNLTFKNGHAGIILDDFSNYNIVSNFNFLNVGSSNGFGIGIGSGKGNYIYEGIINSSSRDGILLGVSIGGDVTANNIFRDIQLINISRYGLFSYYASSGTVIGNNTLINVSYQTESVESPSNITRKWYFQTQVNDSSGYLENAQVDIYDKDSNLISSELTDATGSIGIEELTEYVNTGTKAYETPHTIEISKADYTTNNTIYNLTSETNVYHLVTLEVSETAPVSILSSPIDWYNSSSLTNTLVCNSTDTDGNLKNVTIQTWLSGVEESTQTTSITGLTNSTAYTSFGFVGQSTYEWNCYVCDDADNCVWGTNRTIYIDVDAPSVSQTTPANNTNTTTSSQNLTASITDNRGIKNATLHIFNSSDDEINTTTINFGTGVISTTVGVVYDFVDGLFKWIWETFDWSGNSDSDSNYTIGIDDTNTVVNIVYPLNDTYYNFANFTINSTQTDNYAGLDSCWYTNDSLTNYTFTCGQNISANLSEGTFTYVIYSNDTFGNIGSDSVTFHVSLGAPAINLNSPLANQYLDNGTDIYFNFTATDSDGLDTCKLYGNWTGTYHTNYTWVGPESSVMNWTTQNISEGQYIFAVWCNDTLNTERTTDNRTFEIDLTYPNVMNSHYVPTTIYTETDVIIYGNITDTNLDTVWININSTGAYLNTTVTSVGDQYSYSLSNAQIDNFENISWYWYANDSAGNENVSLLNSFEVSNRNPYNVTIDNPSNNSYVSSDSIIINFSSTDADMDTINYTLYNSTDGITFTNYNSTTNTWFNFSGFDTSEGTTNYYYITANDTELQNNSDTDMFTIDVINPNLISIDYPQASPTVQCSLTNIDLNYSVSDTNIDYCTLNVTSGGVLSTAHTRISDCSNVTFNVSFDNTVQLLNFNVVDKAGNSNSTTRLIYVDTDNAVCPSIVGETRGGGGGAIPILPAETGFCGNLICENGDLNTTNRGETFYNCPEDCGASFGDFNLETLLLNCFEEDKSECLWIKNTGLWFIFIFIFFLIIFAFLFEFKPEKKGIKKWVFRPKKRWKRR